MEVIIAVIIGCQLGLTALLIKSCIGIRGKKNILRGSILQLQDDKLGTRADVKAVLSKNKSHKVPLIQHLN
jgi:hypothetical protein